ncbi:hypothetical protein FRC11_007176, partial [Ceratobasidium sp. 423]
MERETNYIHHGWSLGAVSTISPWISSRIAVNNQPNAEGTWLTRRALVLRFRVRVSLADLVPAEGFKAEIEAALEKRTVFTKFEAVYRALHKWGDVVALEIEMGTSLVFTDLETNVHQLPDTATWNEIRNRLAASQTARTTRQEGMDYLHWENEEWPNLKTTVSPIHWCQTRIREVVATTRLLPVELQDQLSQLYAQRLSYAPVIAHGDGPRKAHDDAPYTLKRVSSIIVYATVHIRSITFSYADKSLSKHEGSETGGFEHEFVLTDGEHITEIFIWRGDWIHGIQFVTNFGRCSLQFGGGWGTPTVARSKGGVLVGAASLIKEDAYVFRLHDIQ